jgi:hypothetical protein
MSVQGETSDFLHEVWSPAIELLLGTFQKLKGIGMDEFNNLT